MRPLLPLAMPLLAVSALAESLPPCPLPAMADSEPAPELPRFVRHQSLDGILVFVCDKSSADAAAQRVREQLEFYDSAFPEADAELLRELCYRCDYYGSAALRDVLARFLPRPSDRLRNFITRTEQLHEECQAADEELAAVVAAVHDEESLAKARAALQAFPAFMHEKDKQLSFSTYDFPGNHDEFLSAVDVACRDEPFASLLHAYGQVQRSREGGYPELEEAMRAFFLNYVNTPEGYLLRQQLCDLLAKAPASDCEAQHAAVREWFALASNISDQSTADAAADWLRRYEANNGKPLWSIWRRACPCLGKKAMHLRNVYHYLHRANWYGSERLQNCFPPTR